MRVLIVFLDLTLGESHPSGVGVEVEVGGGSLCVQRSVVEGMALLRQGHYTPLASPGHCPSGPG